MFAWFYIIFHLFIGLLSSSLNQCTVGKQRHGVGWNFKTSRPAQFSTKPHEIWTASRWYLYLCSIDELLLSWISLYWFIQIFHNFPSQNWSLKNLKVISGNRMGSKYKALAINNIWNLYYALCIMLWLEGTSEQFLPSVITSDN